MAKKQWNATEDAAATAKVTKEVANDIITSATKLLDEEVVVEEKKTLKELYGDKVPLHILNSLS